MGRFRADYKSVFSIRAQSQSAKKETCFVPETDIEIARRSGLLSIQKDVGSQGLSEGWRGTFGLDTFFESCYQLHRFRYA